ncbi:hypothetical protein EXIGLDRAFT_725105 [Exidia glandulosa HHB12029]|uniref:Uncharacterized protein n=1 Tax=Exidia glandulosa HHB12029 TaxID=1314781 RepID=A0A165E6G8_EXIGL|nr:hypothetical protein EXIGLDRAFT_725105 [Exidia glandulosa HHB12029]
MTVLQADDFVFAPGDATVVARSTLRTIMDNYDATCLSIPNERSTALQMNGKGPVSLNFRGMPWYIISA